MSNLGVSEQQGNGNLLIEGDGKYNIRELMLQVIQFVGSIIFLSLGFGSLPSMIEQARWRGGRIDFFGQRINIQQAESLVTIFVVAGILGLIVSIIFTTLAFRRFLSEIKVYENCITGKTVTGIQSHCRNLMCLFQT